MAVAVDVPASHAHREPFVGLRCCRGPPLRERAALVERAVVQDDVVREFHVAAAELRRTGVIRQQLELRARRYEVRIVLALSAARKARGGATIPNVRGRRMGNRRQQRDTKYRCKEHDQGFLLHGRTFLMNDERGHV